MRVGESEQDGEEGVKLSFQVLVLVELLISGAAAICVEVTGGQEESRGW